MLSFLNSDFNLSLSDSSPSFPVICLSAQQRIRNQDAIWIAVVLWWPVWSPMISSMCKYPARLVPFLVTAQQGPRKAASVLSMGCFLPITFKTLALTMTFIWSFQVSWNAKSFSNQSSPTNFVCLFLIALDQDILSAKIKVISGVEWMEASFPFTPPSSLLIPFSRWLFIWI